jgi:hypothetical protein
MIYAGTDIYSGREASRLESPIFAISIYRPLILGEVHGWLCKQFLPVPLGRKSKLCQSRSENVATECRSRASGASGTLCPGTVMTLSLPPHFPSMPHSLFPRFFPPGSDKEPLTSCCDRTPSEGVTTKGLRWGSIVPYES